MSLLLCCLQLAQVGVEAIEAAFPQRAVPLGPGGDFLEQRGLDPARTPLRVASARDEAGALEHAQVLRHGRQAHVEGVREIRHRLLARREPREDRAPRRIGEGGKRGTEGVGVHGLYLTIRLFNRQVQYYRWP